MNHEFKDYIVSGVKVKAMLRESGLVYDVFLPGDINTTPMRAEVFASIAKPVKQEDK